MDRKYMALLEKAAAWIEEHREEFITELQGLARIPSVSRADLAQPGAPFGPDCRRVLDYALERGRVWGFETEDHDGYAGSIYWGDRQKNTGVIAHLDVVPVGEGWVFPPFGATYLPEHDVLIGRGVDDDKAGAVAGLFAMRMLREFGWEMKRGVRLICGLSEETGMADMLALKERGIPFPDVSLVPDAGFPVNFGQKGSVDAEITAPCQGNLIAFDSGTVRNVIPDKAESVLSVDEETVRAAMAALPEEDTSMLTIAACPEGTRITASGKSGHAAFPAGSDNAIQRLTRALTLSGLLEGSCAGAIAQLSDLTSDTYGRSEGVAYSDDVSGELTLVYGVAHLQGGVLHVSVDSRYCITLDGEKLVEDLKKDWARRGYEISRMHISHPFYIPKDDPRVVALQQLYQAATGRDDEPYTMGGGTYSRVVPNAISFGPGLPGEKHDWSAFLPEGHGSAHGRDETIAMSKLHTCTLIYTAALAMLDEIAAADED